MVMKDNRPSNVVGVRFSPAGRVQFFDPARWDLATGDVVTVDTEEGPRNGEVVIAPGQVLYSELRDSLRPVVNKVEPEDGEPTGPKG